MKIQNYISSSWKEIAEALTPWELIDNLESVIDQIASQLGEGFTVDGKTWIHQSASIHPSATVQAPAIIGEGTTVGPHAFLRAGVILGENVNIGGGCEIKSTIVLNGSAVAHLNYVGNSVIGESVNIEAGAVIANHFNEREDKAIRVKIDGEIIETGVKKFGALVGDGSRIGANAVTTPGTILPKGSIVKRLELVDQLTGT